MINPQKLINDLKQLGIREDDTVVVHSSYNALRGDSQIDGGPAAVIAALKETVKRGTLLLPTLSWESVTEDSPHFDVMKTPGCVGILPEFMRKSSDCFRSIHPTHSIAVWGKDARMIADAHIRDFTPVGPNSPLHETRRRGGKIIMLGCSLETNTSMHGVEEMVVPPYLYGKNFDYEIVLRDGTSIWQSYLWHGFDGIADQRYERIINVITDADYRTGKVLNADCTVMDAEAVWSAGLKKLREDIMYFVDVEVKNL